MSKTENIFESVRLIGINEGVGLDLLGLVLKIISIPSKRMDEKVKRHVQQILTMTLNENENLLPLKKKLKRGTRVISPSNLAKRVKINDNDIKVIENNDISVLAMVDTSNNILAYCLIDAALNRSIRFGYSIVDKTLGNSKDLNMFVQATFEFKLGIYGDGIKYFTDKYKKVGSFHGSDSLNDDVNKTANYLSKVESEAVIKNIESLSKIVLNKAKTLFSNVLIYDNERSGAYSDLGFVTLSFYNDELFTKFDKDGDISDEDFDKEKEVFNTCNEKFISLMNSIDFKTKENFGYVSSDDKRYRNIKIDFESDDEYFGYYYISIYTNRKLHK